jgi:signal transduction histidine kinase
MPSRLKTLGFILLLWGCGLAVYAQHNPYKIDDSLYAYYKQMVRLKTDSICLKMVDTLYERAFALGDAKAQCLAYTIPVNYYFYYPGCYAQLHTAADNLRSIARQAGYLRYYFFATSNEVTYLLNEGRSGQAIRLAHQMHDEAFDSGNPHGIYSSLMALGNVYYMRHEFQKALDAYTQAYNHLMEHLPDQDDTQILSRMASCYAEMHQPEKALQHARKALTTARTESALLRAMEQDLAFFYKFGATEEFLHYYAKGKDVMTRVGYIYREGWYQVETYKSLHEKDYRQAHAYADKIDDVYESARLHSEIYVAENDFRHAYEYATRAGEANEKRLLLQQNQDLDELEAQERREQLNNQMRALKEEQDRIEGARHLLRMRLFFVVTVLVFVVLALVALFRHRHACVLTAKNRELETARQVAVKARTVAEEAQAAAEKAQATAEEARDKAEMADRMKTVFVQNMSHEIRTPLNAIVGFSSILADPNFDLPPEERQDLSDRIVQNSDLLTTLINDILDLSNLESGKYEMDLQTVSANTLCTYAMDTVFCRKPKDVEIRFDSDVPDDFTFTTDGMRVQQVLVNFLTNAEKNTEQGSIHLHCSAQERPGFVTYSVEDTGIGVPPEKAEAIFERFTKLDDFKQGSGLGLSICSVISDRLGGHVYLDTHYHPGARFVFEVPVGPKVA